MDDFVWNLGHVNYCFVVGGGKDRKEMSDEYVEKIIMVIERRKQIVNAMRKIIKMLEVVRNEQID